MVCSRVSCRGRICTNTCQFGQFIAVVMDEVEPIVDYVCENPGGYILLNSNGGPS